MATETPAPPASPDEGRHRSVQDSAEFRALRRAFRSFVFPTTVAFLVWYALYVVLSAYARGFMGTKVVGHINVALVFGLLQFASTFLIAWGYARYAGRRLDPDAARLREAIEERADLEGGRQ
ncbi:DUF485 domain-containing protein [Rugosimonospora acidiphila]|uniref:DUF485 domain-containing protein n=1 Tax=Rugosimonospora acidiphila TaxID=556531 RepID=A0ABP9S1F5_9ACTN